MVTENTISGSDASVLAQKARHEILIMTSHAKASHVGSALSVVDILATLYSGAANISPQIYEKDFRDVVILSKGHSAAALYSILALKEFFSRAWLKNYCQNGAELGGHVTSTGVPGIELSTGSLGHGLPYGTGVALARKLDKTSGKIFVVISDGECDEGTTWESALIANQHALNNLVVIIDRNRIQSLGSTEETLRLEPLADKWESFGWKVLTVDGHNFPELARAVSKDCDGPLCVIAETIKGKGVSFMENTVLWHYRPPDEAQLKQALDEISGSGS
jgi:transketolase